jgi:hypothetical protein
MHYHAEVYIPPNVNEVKEYIEEVMVPHSEYYQEEDGPEEYNENGIYDWYQIGGRWMGAHTNYDYDPTSDPQNTQTCNICGGTGFRNDPIGLKFREEASSYTCNGCGVFDEETKQWTHSKFGPGIKVKWPTQWVEYDGDVIDIKQLKDDFSCYTLIVGDKVFLCENWTGKEFVTNCEFDGNVIKKLTEFGITEGRVATVDYHS